MNHDYKIEDLLEALVGLTVLPGKHWKDKCFQLHVDNSKVLNSIGHQVFKGSALTQKQHALVKKLLLEYYTEPFTEQGIDITKHVDQIREPYRNVDKSHWVKFTPTSNGTFVSIRFPFSNQVIEHLNDLKNNDLSKDEYFYEKHTHNFLATEQNVYKVVTIANKFKEQFDVDTDVQLYYNELVEFTMNKDKIIPGIYENEFKNMSSSLAEKLSARYNNPNESLLELWDRRYLYGLHRFPDFTFPQDLTTLTHKLLDRKNSSVFIRSTEWTLNQVLESLNELNRFPCIMLIDPDVASDHLSMIYNACNGFLANEEISVMFRLDNKTNGEFNQFIRDKGLNNNISSKTRLVVANRKKITKPIIKSNWEPVCVLSLGDSRGSHSYAREYVERFDLKLFWTVEDSMISTYTRHRDTTYTTGVQTI